MHSDLIKHLLEDGSMIEAGVSESGEPLYSFTNMFQVNHPGLYEKAYKDFLEDIDELWLLGFLEISVGKEKEDDEVMVTDWGIQNISKVPGRLASTFHALCSSALDGG